MWYTYTIEKIYKVNSKSKKSLKYFTLGNKYYIRPYPKSGQIVIIVDDNNTERLLSNNTVEEHFELVIERRNRIIQEIL